MKWNKIINLALISVLVSFLLSCGQIAEQVAGEDMVGSYQGSETMVTQLSKFNLGLDDEIVTNTTTFNVIMNDDGKCKIVFSDVNFVLSAVQLATNGTVFNIPEQSIVLEGNQIKVRGLNECTFGDMRCDGFYNSETKKLIFSFEGLIPTVEYGVQYDVPFSLSYEVTKL
jgi:hypothetical protein